MPGGPIFNCYPGPFSNVRCITDHVALGAHIKERFVFGNDTGHFLFAYGLHLKYQF